MEGFEEFRSNLLLLLQCRYPEGLPLSQLEGEYKLYFQQDLTPTTMGMGLFSSWKQILEHHFFREDFLIYEIGQNAYVKPIRKRTALEMSLIAKLARMSHLNAAKDPEFQLPGCFCCPLPGQYVAYPYSHQQPFFLQMSTTGDEAFPLEYSNVEAVALNGTEELQMNGDIQAFPTNGTSDVHADPGLSMQYADSVGYQAASAQGEMMQQLDTSDVNDSSQLSFTLSLSPDGQVDLVPCFPTPPEAVDSIPSYSAAAALEVVHQAQVECETATVVAPENSQPKPIVRKVFKCSTPKCNMEFSTLRELKEHVPRCFLRLRPITFPPAYLKASNQRLANRVVIAPADSQSENGSESEFKCSVLECTASFTSICQFKAHEILCRLRQKDRMSNKKANFRQQLVKVKGRKMLTYKRKSQQPPKKD